MSKARMNTPHRPEPPFPASVDELNQTPPTRDGEWDLVDRLERLERARQLTKGEIEAGSEICCSLGIDMHRTWNVFGEMIHSAILDPNGGTLGAIRAFFYGLHHRDREYLSRRLRGETPFVDAFVWESEETSDRVQDLRLNLAGEFRRACELVGVAPPADE